MGFWETQLFFVAKFRGNPARKHQLVDAQNHYRIESRHFGVWLNLWYETLDTFFTGERSMMAKNRARSMGTVFYLKIFEARPKKT